MSGDGATPRGATEVVRVEGLSKAYAGVQAVTSVSFALAAGEILALIGPNGAGKSTCFNMLNGQIRPDSGTIRILGRDTAGMPPRRIWRLGVGRTFQIAAAFASMTVRENVQVALLSHAGRLGRMRGSVRRQHAAEADALLARVGLGAAAHRPCGELAYGDVKRLELAVALANAPRVLLMDEPTAGMAPRERGELMRLTASIARAEGIGVLFTEHDMDVVFEHADRLMVLSRGAVIARGRPDQVRADPTVRAVYLGEGRMFAGQADGEAAEP